uniref:G-protein coupled receptors family 3 profile domain-containing protein n=1 Tax=Sinocyclocheilus anshuiensis TaxID=1608454 RepID=A0A671PYF0_9TELE
MIGDPKYPLLSKDGDMIIGALFPIRSIETLPSFVFTKKPQPLSCSSVNLRDFRRAQTMIFAIEEINRSESLLPNVSIGYRIYDTCGSRLSSMSATMALMNGHNVAAGDTYICKQSLIHAIIGETESSTTVILSRTTGPFKIPVISHSATCECLSNRKDYPFFFRTIASDYHQSRALAYIVKLLGWSWVGTVNTDNDYGNNGMAIFLNTAQEEGICVEYSVKFYRTEPDKLQKVVETIKKSTAKVIVAFLTSYEMYNLLEHLSIQNITGLQMIGVEAWITAKRLITPNSFHVLGGSLGFAVRKIDIEGFEDYVTKVFWETAFPCLHTEGNSSQYAVNCNIYRDLLVLKNFSDDVPEQRYASNVYNAVYAVAHSLHSLLKCKEGCEKDLLIQPQQVAEALKKVNFTVKMGDSVWFDSTGGVIAQYEVINWQQDSDGSVQFKPVGYYDASLPPDQRFLLNAENIIWVGGQLEKPRSVCSESCPPGTRKATQKGRPVCCYDCIPCAEGEISNERDSNDCKQCPAEYWSNAEKNKCVLKAVEFLSFTEVMGIVLVFFSLFGAGLTTLMAILFYSKKDTPIVKANNSELSFLLLFSLSLCFLCSLTFIGRPTEWSCMLRHTAFGITFVLCISCVLGKTIVVLMAFKATLPGSNVMKWFGPAQQRLSVLAFTLIQVLISFLARTLPDNFNEAKFITFSMLIFCAVWITFIPAYVSSPGKVTVAVEIFTILASSFGLLFCIFSPKCYIMLFKPEQNTKQHMMGKVPSKSY